MAGFVLNHDAGIFRYIFDNNSIVEFKSINGVNIPFSYLEDWYVIYQLISNREAKVNMIDKYILSNRISKTILLERALEGCLSIEVKLNISSIFNY